VRLAPGRAERVHRREVTADLAHQPVPLGARSLVHDLEPRRRGSRSTQP